MFRVAINGMGRIGRAAFKIVLDTPELKLAAVNDLMSPEDIAYLLKFDTVYGRYEKDVVQGKGLLKVEGVEYQLFSEKDPEKLPWKEMAIDVVLECTGMFGKREDLEKHLRAGANRVILSAPSKSEEVFTMVHGVNEPDHDVHVISCASCTTNCITPVVEIMGRRIGIEKAAMTTIHAYTSTQNIVDGFNKKIRRGRAAAANLVPTSTGAALATTKVLPDYIGKFDGMAVRAPVPVGSIADISFVTSRNTTVEEVNGIFRAEAAGAKYRGIVGVSEEQIVSADIIKDPRASVVDLTLTQVIGGNLVKVFSWYDNEWGYANQLVREAVRLSEALGT